MAWVVHDSRAAKADDDDKVIHTAGVITIQPQVPAGDGGGGGSRHTRAYHSLAFGRYADGRDYDVIDVVESERDAFKCLGRLAHTSHFAKLALSNLSLLTCSGPFPRIQRRNSSKATQTSWCRGSLTKTLCCTFWSELDVSIHHSSWLDH